MGRTSKILGPCRSYEQDLGIIWVLGPYGSYEQDPASNTAPAIGPKSLGAKSLGAKPLGLKPLGPKSLGSKKDYSIAFIYYGRQLLQAALKLSARFVEIMTSPLSSHGS